MWQCSLSVSHGTPSRNRIVVILAKQALTDMGSPFKGVFLLLKDVRAARARGRVDSIWVCNEACWLDVDQGVWGRYGLCGGNKRLTMVGACLWACLGTRRACSWKHAYAWHACLARLAQRMHGQLGDADGVQQCHCSPHRPQGYYHSTL